MRIEYPKKFIEILLCENDAYNKIQIKEEDFLKQCSFNHVDELIKVMSNIDLNQVYTLVKTTVAKNSFKSKNYLEYVSDLEKYLSSINSYLEESIHIEGVIDFEEPIQIFISHSSANDQIIERLKNLLVDLGIYRSNIIMLHASDYLELDPGDFYLNKIKEKISNSEVLLTVMDKHFSKSQMCNVELGMALSLDLLILPVFISDSERDSDSVFNKASHIETLRDYRYLKKMLALLGCKIDSKRIKEFINEIGQFIEIESDCSSII